jgi:exopolysaccharide biosynthesis WecB/TagA/CpsF family protein
MAYADDHQLAGLEEPADRQAVRILGVPFAPLTVDEAISRARAMLQGGSHQIVIANAHTLNLAYLDAAYLDVLRHASLVLRDGVGIEIASRLLRRRLRYNFVGTDFVPLLLRMVAAPRLRVFLFGAAPGVAVAAGDALKRSSPAIEIVGTENGYVDFDDVAERVQSSRPDILLVALGNPLQERWIAANLSRLDVRVAIGVGALFDFLAGRVPRAPQWIRTLRCEWLYRFCLEPGRLWRRYLIGNVQFLWRVTRAGRSQRL